MARLSFNRRTTRVELSFPWKGARSNGGGAASSFEEVAASVAIALDGTWLERTDTADERRWDLVVGDVRLRLQLTGDSDVKLFAPEETRDLRAALYLIEKVHELLGSS